MKLKYIMILFAAMTLMACGSDNKNKSPKTTKKPLPPTRAPK